jgi:hypothetical protein
MTPKEKAIELVHKFCSTTEGLYKSKKNIKNAKQCALIAVDEIIASNPITFDEDDNCIEKNWWKEVKTEIEKL